MITEPRFPATCLAADIKAFEAERHKVLNLPHTEAQQVISYVLEGRGKRYRPCLILSLCHLFGYDGNDRYQLAVAVECIHDASLVHDDIIDEAVTRRGRKTVHKLWGEKTAVLIGDFLYSRAFELIGALDNDTIVRIFAQVANRLSIGELRQLRMNGKRGLTRGDDWCYEVMHEKTAIFFGACCEAAALISNANTYRARSRNFGRALGMLFQIRDDVLDYGMGSGTEAKNLLQDLSKGKVTLPLLYTYLAATKKQKKLIEEALDSLREKDLSDVRQLVSHSAAFSQIAEKARDYARQAEISLEGMPNGKIRDSLSFLVENLMKNA